MSAPEHLRTLANIREQLIAVGFSFHTGDEVPADPDLAGRHWYCWCGPRNEWDVECGDNHDTETGAIAEAAMALATFQREKLEEIAAHMRETAPRSCADAVEGVCMVLEQLAVGYAVDENEDACVHDWVHTGTAYGGEDESYRGEGRVYCSKCGADGDA